MERWILGSPVLVRLHERCVVCMGMSESPGESCTVVFSVQLPVLILIYIAISRSSCKSSQSIDAVLLTAHSRTVNMHCMASLRRHQNDVHRKRLRSILRSASKDHLNCTSSTRARRWWTCGVRQHRQCRAMAHMTVTHCNPSFRPGKTSRHLWLPFSLTAA